MATLTRISCPRMRSRIDKCIPEEEWALIVYHECKEAEYMKGGMSYDKAHEKVKAEEDEFRRLLVTRKKVPS